MSDESITSSISSGLRSFGGSVKSLVSGLFRDRKHRDEPTGEASSRKNTVAAPDAALTREAAKEILSYTRHNQSLLDRAERYGQRAERLSEDGTTYDTATNKAERARQEILAGLAALRASFIDRNDEDEEKAGAAFDQESEGVIPNPAAG